MTRQRCAGNVPDPITHRLTSCSRAGTIRRDADWFCWQHSPEAVEKRRAEVEARWADVHRQRAEANRRLAAERLAVGFLATTSLEAGIVKGTFTSHDRLADAAREVSTRLRAVGGAWNILLAQDLESALKEAHSGTD